MNALGLCLLAAVAVCLPSAARADGAPPVQVHVYVQAGIPTRMFDRARDIATRLLSSAGVDGQWRLCATEAPCVNPAGFRPTVTVIVRVLPGPADRPCGAAAHEPERAAGTVIVDYGCVADLAQLLHFGPRRLTYPQLAAIGVWDIAGLVMAHEIGHIAGLRHAAHGVMHHRLDVEDLVGLSRDKLRFTRGEAATLRAALVSTLERATARGKRP